MDLKDVIFIGGDLFEYASNKIRCRDVAKALGCEMSFGALHADEIPQRYRVFICVKPKLPPEELEKLGRRGAVVWDVVDGRPPQQNIAAYITSTHIAAEHFKGIGRLFVIPHHHCNFTNVFNRPTNRRVMWIGNHPWYPRMDGVAHDAVFIRGKERLAVVRAYRRAGILLNFRTQEASGSLHVKINSGIKLINSIGFGIPSVSADEPAYHEVASDCTIFSQPGECHSIVEELTRNSDLYDSLRRRCIERSRQFSIRAIARKYREMVRAL